MVLPRGKCHIICNEDHFQVVAYKIVLYDICVRIRRNGCRVRLCSEVTSTTLIQIINVMGGVDMIRCGHSGCDVITI